MSTESLPELIVFHYAFSPWGRKLTTYLSLRNIPYLSCFQPVTIPRPDLESIGVQYRRIPVLSIGKDIYCDTAQEIHKLETKFFPPSEKHPGLASTDPNEQALEELLTKWAEVIGWKYAAQAIPVSLDSVFDNPAFLKDRTELFGREWSKESQVKLRVESDLVFRAQFDFLENTLLRDGRTWILGGTKNNTTNNQQEAKRDGPTLADIQIGWLFDWMRDVGGCFPPELEESSGNYPKLWAWLNRYRDAVNLARERLNAGEIPSSDAIERILNSPYAESDFSVRKDDPTGLKEGEVVEGYPSDYGSTHRDVGRLVGLTADETVIETDKGTRVHQPRWQFAVHKK